VTTDRHDQGVDFAWSDAVRIRVERRARELRRGRRNVLGLVGGLVALVVAVIAVTLPRSGSSGERVATTAPDPTAALAQLLPPPSSVVGVLPQLRLKEVSGGGAYGVVTPAELIGFQGAQLGVTRQWVSGTGSVQLQPGQRFPDEVTTVISTIVRFDNAADARAWTRQAVARAVLPIFLPVDGTTSSDVVVLRAPGELGELQYLAFFTNGDLAFGLQMIAGGSDGRDGEFLRLVQDWTRQTAVPATASTTESSNASRSGGPTTSPPSSRP
jgi:hypothetical protein